MPNLTTIAKWAASIGISRQQGYSAVNRCGIPVTDGKLDPDQASILYRENTRLRAGAGSGGKEDAGDPEKSANSASASEYAKQRARRESSEADIAEMKAAEMSGKYLDKADVDASLFEVARSLRDGLTNCARRIAAEVAGLQTADECEVVIDREHRALIESLARTLLTKLTVNGAAGGMESGSE
ncbi:MAG TPA: hypothetical protein VGC21_16170 [Telluria sp.]|jgi:phage terminase Nu1 subunit (DNA packaging protein)